MIFLIYPCKQCFRFVVIYSSSLWPISFHAGNRKVRVTFRKYEFIFIQLISDFFTRGVARNHMSVGWNVRQFDCEEVNPFESTVYNNSISRITMYILGGVQCLLRPSMCCVSKHAGECNTLSQIVLDLHHTDFQGKWRQAALELFQFPPSLPLSLHPCPPAQV